MLWITSSTGHRQLGDDDGLPTWVMYSCPPFGEDFVMHLISQSAIRAPFKPIHGRVPLSLDFGITEGDTSSHM
jgi:hypothetical protein